MLGVLKELGQRILWACALAGAASLLTVASHAATFAWEMAFFVVPMVALLFAFFVSVPLGILGQFVAGTRLFPAVASGIGTLAGTLAGLGAGQEFLERSTAYAPNAPPDLPFWTLAAFVVAGSVTGSVAMGPIFKPRTDSNKNEFPIAST